MQPVLESTCNEKSQCYLYNLSFHINILSMLYRVSTLTLNLQPRTKYLEKFRYFTFHVIIASPHPPVQCCCSQFSHRHAKFTLLEIINMINIVPGEGGVKVLAVVSLDGNSKEKTVTYTFFFKIFVRDCGGLSQMFNQVKGFSVYVNKTSDALHGTVVFYVTCFGNKIRFRCLPSI